MPPRAVAGDSAEGWTAANYIEGVQEVRSDEQQRKVQRYFKSGKGQYGEGDVFIGVPMGEVFKLSKRFIAMPLDELEKLLESPIHEARAGAVKIMWVQATAKRTTEERRQELFDLYLRRIDRINNWDLVDLGAPEVVGGYLFKRPRDLLFRLARSEDLWERRTAIVATYYFVRRGDLDDGYRVAEILINDPHDLIRKPVGSFLRWAGQKDLPRLTEFLDRYAATMPRTTLRYALEHFDAESRAHYMGLAKATPPTGP
ncbi:MAG: DNA alkylation repair protein [Actinobacteria bacterium]|nr:DNA alkylation repair protein [Actinomycetota bacterium]